MHHLERLAGCARWSPPCTWEVKQAWRSPGGPGGLVPWGPGMAMPRRAGMLVLGPRHWGAEGAGRTSSGRPGMAGAKRHEEPLHAQGSSHCALLPQWHGQDHARERANTQGWPDSRSHRGWAHRCVRPDLPLPQGRQHSGESNFSALLKGCGRMCTLHCFECKTPPDPTDTAWGRPGQRAGRQGRDLSWWLPQDDGQHACHNWLTRCYR